MRVPRVWVDFSVLGVLGGTRNQSWHRGRTPQYTYLSADTFHFASRSCLDARARLFSVGLFFKKVFDTP